MFTLLCTQWTWIKFYVHLSKFSIFLFVDKTFKTKCNQSYTRNSLPSEVDKWWTYLYMAWMNQNSNIFLHVYNVNWKKTTLVKTCKILIRPKYSMAKLVEDSNHRNHSVNKYNKVVQNNHQLIIDISNFSDHIADQLFQFYIIQYIYIYRYDSKRN